MEGSKQEKAELKKQKKEQRLKAKYKINVHETGHLSDLKVGQKGKVLALHQENKELRRRLLDMGITKGVEILVKKVSPLGDPIDIELRGYELCIRKSDMENIDIEVIE